MTKKSIDFAAKFNLADKISADAKSGTLSLPDDYYESTLEDVGVSIDQIKKLQKHDASLLAATTLVAGEKAAEIFKENEDIHEVSFNYGIGQSSAHGHFGRAREDHAAYARNIVSVHGAGDKGELGKVHKHLNTLFSEVNS